MTDRPRTTGEDRSQDASADGFRRREFVALGAGVSATMLAGCAGDGDLTSSDGSDGSDGTDGTDGSETLTGNFRLLISDAPADIGDFDQLNVTLDEARVFEAQDGEDEADDDEDDETEDEETDGEDDGSDQTGNEIESDSPNGTADEDDGEDDAENDGEDDEDTEGDRGFTVVDLDDATVDLTRVIEEDAMAVFDGEIPAGSYEKIELSVTTVEGTVDGEEVDVKLPSEKLQITNGFEVTPDEPVSFVFDINVVKRGQNNGYILQPVISGSGVAGRDVEVNEIDDDDEEEADDEEADDEEADDEEADDEEAVESADEDDGDDGATENETADAENGTADGS